MLATLISDRQLELHLRQLQTDYIIRSPAHPPTASSSMIFASEVSRSWTHNSFETEPCTISTVLQQMTNLPYLETLHIRKAALLTTEHVATILFCCPSLKQVDLSGSGKPTDDPDLWHEVLTEASKFWIIKRIRKTCVKRLSLIRRSITL